MGDERAGVDERFVVKSEMMGGFMYAFGLWRPQRGLFGSV